MIVVPDVSAIEHLEILIPGWTAYVHLYVEDIPLDRGTVKADFVEASYPGYAAQLATGWSDPEIAGGRALTSAEPLVFSREDGEPRQDVWGYFVTKGPTGALLWAERFEGPPWPMQVSTDQISIVPRFSDRGERRKLHTGL